MLDRRFLLDRYREQAGPDYELDDDEEGESVRKASPRPGSSDAADVELESGTIGSQARSDTPDLSKAQRLVLPTASELARSDGDDLTSALLQQWENLPR